jgi:imidazolonepropionase-like amidohydrolase
MGREADLGTLAKGKYADIVILDADPVRDVRNMRRIFKVIKNGQVVNISQNSLK